MESERPRGLEAMQCELEQRAAEAARMEEALRQSEARYRRVFDAGGDALFVLDLATLRILDANRAAIEPPGGVPPPRRVEA
jgi:PAS domain-containing protein